MPVRFDKPACLTDMPMHYCPGCTHGIIHRLTAKAIDDLGIEGRTIGVASVGCSVFAYNYFTCDMQQAAHGRAPAVATGIKRSLPDKIVFTYQGDGDLAKRREHYGDFRKQCNLRNDRGTDGPHNPKWAGDLNHPLRKTAARRISDQDVRNSCHH